MSLNLKESLGALDKRIFGHYIDGAFDYSDPAGTGSVLNPVNGESLVEVPMGGSEQVDRAVAAARSAFAGWRGTPPSERAGALTSLADKIEAHGALLARLESLDVGMPIRVSRDELEGAPDVLRFMAAAVRTAQAPAADQYVRGQLSIIRREPVGVVAAISPWNYPLLMGLWKVAPALAAGNTVVLKPASITPLASLLLAELTRDVLPPGVLNMVIGSGAEIGELLTRHRDVDMVSLTGSVGSGRAVAAGAAATLKRVHLELGGKAPVVVFEDADLEAVAAAVRTAGFWNSGQECGAATRVLCHHAIADRLVEAISRQVETLVVGDPDSGDDIEIGPLVSAGQRENVEGMVDRSIAEGATVVAGGSVVSGPGFFYAPTVVTDLPEGSELVTEEVFGPVVTIQTFADEADALRLANDVEYGLSASVWTEGSARALRMADGLDFGTVWVNSHLTVATEMPWGGFGASGYGRDLSTYSLDDYSRSKHIMIATGAEER